MKNFIIELFMIISISIVIYSTGFLDLFKNPIVKLVCAAVVGFVIGWFVPDVREKIFK